MTARIARFSAHSKPEELLLHPNCTQIELSVIGSETKLVAFVDPRQSVFCGKYQEVKGTGGHIQSLKGVMGIEARGASNLTVFLALQVFKNEILRLTVS